MVIRTRVNRWNTDIVSVSQKRLFVMQSPFTKAKIRSLWTALRSAFHKHYKEIRPNVLIPKDYRTIYLKFRAII